MLEIAGSHLDYTFFIMFRLTSPLAPAPQKEKIFLNVIKVSVSVSFLVEFYLHSTFRREVL